MTSRETEMDGYPIRLSKSNRFLLSGKIWIWPDFTHCIGLHSVAFFIVQVVKEINNLQLLSAVHVVSNGSALMPHSRTKSALFAFAVEML